jgi:hypothetical protein
MQPGYPPGPPGYPPAPPGYPPAPPGTPPNPPGYPPGPPGYPLQHGYPSGQQAAPQSWQWRYMAATFSGTLAGSTLSIKQGIRNFRIEIPSLRFLYMTQTSTRMGTLATLLLCYEQAPGKKKVVRIMSNAGDPGMQAMIAALLALRPDIDIRHLDPKTAHNTMGAARMNVVAGVIAFVLIVAVMGVIMLPEALHGFDSGHANVSVEQLYSGYEPPTHNLTVSGVADLDDAMFNKTTNNGSTTVEYYLPLVPRGWKKSDPVHVVLQTDHLGPRAQERLLHAKQFQGVLDDIMWEGLEGDVHDYLTGHMGLKLADDVRVIHYKEDPQMDLDIFIGVMALTFVIMAVVFAVVAVKRRRNA